VEAFMAHAFPIAHSRWLSAAVALAVALPLLAACGPLPGDSTPTPASGDPAAGNGAATTLPETRPPAPPLGSLVDKMDASWKDLSSYRAVFTGTLSTAPESAGIAATPVAGAAEPATIIQEAVLPDRRRQVLTGAGSDDHEAIVDGPVLYLRGPLAAEVVPGAPADVWFSMPTTSISTESEAGHVLGGLLVPPRSPLAGVGPNLRPQGMRDLGPRSVNGRSCRAWGVADTTEIGTRLDITIAVDGRNLPCQLETRVGTEVVSSVIYESIDGDLAIEPPIVATPVVPGPGATPEAHD
jgi:hypothetical protein